MYKISPNITKEISRDSSLLVTVADLGAWLNLSSGMITLQTDLLTDLIKTATMMIEKYAWLALNRITYEANFELTQNSPIFRNSETTALSLERAPIVSLDDIGDITYLDTDGTYTAFSKGATTAEGLYETVTEKTERRKWASILFLEPIEFDSRDNTYKIKIQFIAGFTSDTIPADLKTAIKMIAAFMYTNRGDCANTGCSMNGVPVPCVAKGIVDKYSVAKTTLGNSYTPSDRGCLL